jgi:hypothetical protein
MDRGYAEALNRSPSFDEDTVKRTRIYLLMTTLAVVLAASYATSPRDARAADSKHLWEIFPDYERCSGSCASGQRCCTIVIAPAP